jgi:outer membrane protein OmpA-like peptidoglycan-associated protein
VIRKASILLLVAVFAASCASTTTDPNDPNGKAKRGAGVGAAAGAIVGAIIGNQSGDNRTGAIIGAAAGAAIGAAVGHKMDKQQEELQQIPGVEVTRPAENEIAVRLINDILFDFNSYALRPESRDTLRELANNFRQYPDEQISVEGHTDNVGSDDYNQRLSQQRADSVRNYLVDQGVPNERVTSAGFGKSQPKAGNDTPEGRQLNRRVEIHIRSAQS